MFRFVRPPPTVEKRAGRETIIPVAGASEGGESFRMVLGWVEYDDGRQAQPARSSWQKVEAAERSPRMPCLLIPQPAHAVLAGDLADALLPESFGALPPEIRQAIRMHDTGWASSDAQQLQRLRTGAGTSKKADHPVPFVAVDAAQAVEAWTASIESNEALSKTGATIVSRHFTFLAQPGEAAHRRFVKVEKSRQERLRSAIKAPEHDLERWTAALGFCDLLSLYLITGLRGPTDFPLAHPASPAAGTAAQVTLRLEERQLLFTPSVFRSGCALELDALRHPAPAKGPRAETLQWEVV